MLIILLGHIQVHGFSPLQCSFDSSLSWGLVNHLVLQGQVSCRIPWCFPLHPSIHPSCLPALISFHVPTDLKASPQCKLTSIMWCGDSLLRVKWWICAKGEISVVHHASIFHLYGPLGRWLCSDELLMFVSCRSLQLPIQSYCSPLIDICFTLALTFGGGSQGVVVLHSFVLCPGRKLI